MKRVIANLGNLLRRRPARPSTLIVLPAAVVVASLVAPTARAGDNGSGERNVLLIIGDDIGVDMIGQPYVAYYNWTMQKEDDIAVRSIGEPSTPTLAALKKAGVAFLNHWACPTCSPTRASIITGTYAFRHGVTDPSKDDVFTDGAPTTIAHELSKVAYATGLFGKWHLGDPNAGEGPVDNGWDYYQGFVGGSVPDYYAWTKVTSDPNGNSSKTFTGHDPNNYAPSVTVDDALVWIKEQATKNKRWMATVAFNAAHTASSKKLDNSQVPPTDCSWCYTPADPNDPNQVYRATVEYMDYQISQLLGGIPSDQLDITTIIFVCDNGTEAQFSEHFDRNAAKDSLHEGGVNTALIIADGGVYRAHESSGGKGQVVKPNRISKALVNAVDLFATIADIAGAVTTTDVDSESLVPLLEDPMAKGRDWNFVYATSDNDGWTGWAVRGTQYKLIWMDDGTNELFKLVGDRWESSNLWCEKCTYDHIIDQLEIKAGDFQK